MSFAAAEADRRIGELAQLATVVAVEGNLVRVRAGDMTTHAIPVGQMRAGGVRLRSTPTVGEQVLVVAPGGDLAQAVVVCSFDAASPLEGRGAGLVMDLGGGTLTIVGGDVVVEGGDVIADGVSLKGHVHPESVGILTGPPA